MSSTINAFSGLKVKMPSHRRMIEGFDIVDPQKLTPQQKQSKAQTQQKQNGAFVSCNSSGGKIFCKENRMRPRRRITAVTDDCPDWLPSHARTKSPTPVATHFSSTHPARRRLTATMDDHPQYAAILAECMRLGIATGGAAGSKRSSPSPVDSAPSSPTVTSDRPPVRYRRITATTDARNWLDDSLEVDTLSAPGTPRAA